MHQKSAKESMTTIAVKLAVEFLKIVKDSTSWAPPIQSACASAISIHDFISNLSSNVEAWESLEETVILYIQDVAHNLDGKIVDDDLSKDLRELEQAVKKVNESILQMRPRASFSRMANASSDLAAIGKLEREFKKGLERFTFKSLIAIRDVSTPSTTMPHLLSLRQNFQILKPDIFFGRDSEVETVVALIKKGCKDSCPASVAILGEGGVGKTSLAHAVFCHSDLKDIFLQHRYFVSCETIYSSESLVLQICGALGVKPTTLNEDHLGVLRKHIDSIKQSMSIILDNFENCWISANRQHVLELLRCIASLKCVTFVLTMRGEDSPASLGNGVILTKVVLERLSLQAARSTFLAIAQLHSTQNSPHDNANHNSIKDSLRENLDRILEHKYVSCLPLAVTLLAYNIRSDPSAEGIQVLLERLDSGVEVIKTGSDNRHDCLAASIRVSLHAPRIKNCPGAERLLSIVSLLPSGLIGGEKGDLARHFPEWDIRPATRALLEGSIIKRDNGNLIARPQIRSYTPRYLPPIASDVEKLSQYYLTLLAPYGLGYANPFYFHRLRSQLEPESANISAVLRSIVVDTLKSTPPRRSILRRPSSQPVMSSSTSLLSKLQRRFRNTDLDDREMKQPEASACAVNLEVVTDAILQFSEYLYWTCPNKDLLQALVDVHGKNMSQGHLAQCYLQIGRILFRQGASNLAKSQFERARRLFQHQKDRQGEARCLLELGVHFQIQCHYRVAYDLIDKSKALFEKAHDRRGIGQADCCKADTLYMEKRYSEAQAILEATIPNLNRVEDVPERSQYNERLGNILRMKEDFVTACTFLQEALDTYTDIDYTLGIANCLRSLAVIDNSKDNWPQALEKLERARSIFATQFQHRHGVALCDQTRSDSLYLQGKYDLAETLLLTVRREFQEIGDRFRSAQCSTSLGNIYAIRGQLGPPENHEHELAKAIEFFQVAENEFKVLDDQENALAASLHLGDSLWRIDDPLGPNKAISILLVALKQAEMIEKPLRVAKCHAILGNAYSEAQDHDNAISHLTKAVEEFKRLELPSEVAWGLNYLASAYQGAGDEGRFKEVLLESRARFEEQQNRYGMAVCDEDRKKVSRRDHEVAQRP